MRLVLASASPRRADLLRSAGFTFETLAVDADERPRPSEAPAAYVRRLAGEKSARALDILSRSRAAGTGSRVNHDARGADDLHGSREGGRYLPGADDLVDAVSGFPPLPKVSTRLADQPPPRLRRSAGASAKAEASSAREGGRTVAEDDIVVLGADTAVIVEGVILGKPEDDEDASAMLRRLSGRKHQVLTGVSLRTAAGERGCVEATSVWFVPLSPEAIAWYLSTGEGRDKAGGYAIQGLASRWIPRIEGSYTNVVGLPVAAVASLLEEHNRTYPG
jgi:MAF protein